MHQALTLLAGSFTFVGVAALVGLQAMRAGPIALP